MNKAGKSLLVIVLAAALAAVTTPATASTQVDGKTTDARACAQIGQGPVRAGGSSAGYGPVDVPRVGHFDMLYCDGHYLTKGKVPFPKDGSPVKVSVQIGKPVMLPCAFDPSVDPTTGADQYGYLSNANSRLWTRGSKVLPPPTPVWDWNVALWKATQRSPYAGGGLLVKPVRLGTTTLTGKYTFEGQTVACNVTVRVVRAKTRAIIKSAA